MNLLIEFSLFAFGIIGCISGIKCALNMYNDWHKRSFFMLMGFFVLLWCCGYALMGASVSANEALLFRNIGLLGVLGFLTSEAAFFLYFTNSFGKYKIKILVGIILFDIIDFYLFSKAENLQFLIIDRRMCYLANSTIYRDSHYIWILFLFIILLSVAIRWYGKVTLKREKRTILYLVGSNFFLLFATILDTFLPLLRVPSFPATGYGAFLTYMIMCFGASKRNTFQISEENVGKYIYRYNNSPILIFDYQKKLIMANEYAMNFYHIKHIQEQRLSDIFKISEEEQALLFQELTPYMGKSRKWSTIKSLQICALMFTMIADHYDMPYCYVCIGYDLTREAEIMTELTQVKQQLELQLKKKSQQVDRTNIQTVTTIANMIDARDENSAGHSVRVAVNCEKIGREMGWSEDRIQNLKYVALLHDIGKIGVADSVLHKKSSLSEEEQEIYEKHTVIGSEIVKDISMIEGIMEGTRSHHEHFNGTGYPDKLQKDDIPMIAQIIGIADFYDILMFKDQSSSKKSKKEITELLENEREKRFSSDLIDVFLKILDQDTDSQMDVCQQKEKSFASESSKLFEKIIATYGNENMERDYLTNLWNRRHGEKLISDAMREKGGCLAFIDLDNLKHVNDIYGHLAGDYALKVIGKVLQDLGDLCIASRIGGDEFLIFLPGVSYEKSVNLIEEICCEFQKKKEEELFMRQTSLSLGCYMCTGQSIYEDAVQKADKALYHVKQNGKRGYFFYKESDQGQLNESSIDLKNLMESLQFQGNYAGAYNVNYREFSNIYNFISSMAERYHYTLKLLIITVSPCKNCFLDAEEQEKMLYNMEKSVCETLRKVDVSTRFSSSQLLIILTNAEPESIKKITDRIFEKFHQYCEKNKVMISYDMAEYDHLKNNIDV